MKTHPYPLPKGGGTFKEEGGEWREEGEYHKLKCLLTSC